VFLICKQYANFNEADAYDLVQTIFTKVFQKKYSLEEIKSMKHWLIAIAHNEGKSFLRKKRSATYFTARLKNFLKMDVGPSVDDQLIRRETLSAVAHAVQEIEDPIVQKIVTLFYYENQKVKAIAEVLQMNLSTVTTKLNRFRVSLSKRFTRELLDGFDS
jgi:RNA polymerase sigma-70 factor (ECF subfamily)